MKAKVLSDREKLIQGWEKRIKHHKAQLGKTRKFHREVENGILKKIKLEELQLSSLRRTK